MMKQDELVIMRAVALCYKPFLKPEEALIYCNLGRTQFAKRCQELGITRNAGGYYKKEDIDLICTGAPSKYMELANNLLLKKRGRRGGDN